MTILDQFKQAISNELDQFIKSENILRSVDEKAIADLKEMMTSAASAAALRRRIYHYTYQEMDRKLFYMFRNDLKSRFITLLQSPNYSLEALLIEESQELTRMNTLLLDQVHSLTAMVENNHPEQQKQNLLLQEENIRLKEQLNSTEQAKEALEQTVESFAQKTHRLEMRAENLTNQLTKTQEQSHAYLSENQRLRAKAIQDEARIKQLESVIEQMQRQIPSSGNSKSSSFLSRLVLG